MTERSLPWDGTVTGDAKTYTPLDFTNLLRKILFTEYNSYISTIASGLQQNEQMIIEGIENELVVSGKSISSIQVLSGVGLIDGTFYRNSTSKQLTINAPITNPRIDTVILEKAYPSQLVRIKILTGTEGASPSRNSLTNIVGNIWQTPLADVHVATNGVAIVADRRQLARTPLGPFGTMQHIETITLTDTSQIFVFNDISVKYQSLLLVGSTEQNGIAQIGIRMNSIPSISSNNYSWGGVKGVSAGALADPAQNQNALFIPDFSGTIFDNEKIHIKTIIPFYQQKSFDKAIIADYMSQQISPADQVRGIKSGIIGDTDDSLIYNLEVFLETTTNIKFKIGSTFSLYGIV